MAIKRRKGAMTVYKGSSCNVTKTTKSKNNRKSTGKKQASKSTPVKPKRPVAFCGMNKGFFTMMKEDFYGANSCTLNNNKPNKAQFEIFRSLEFQYFQCGQNIMMRVMANKSKLNFLKY
ncbi:hypothetical protein AAEX28_01575 [Lentisphaerota bacterium WC36G]|nr:hypothetical protein LJT99_04460 [Lentisphaerae bacterium WC36]